MLFFTFSTIKKESISTEKKVFFGLAGFSFVFESKGLGAIATKAVPARYGPVILGGWAGFFYLFLDSDPFGHHPGKLLGRGL